MAALRTLCNGTGAPDFSKLQIGDYLDGIGLSGIAASAANTAGRAWNNTYKNNRIVIAAFNPYKGVGDSEVVQNHILFAFANVPLRARMNPTNNNAGGYAASEMRVFLDGLNGDGTGDFVYTSPLKILLSPGPFSPPSPARSGTILFPSGSCLTNPFLMGRRRGRGGPTGFSCIVKTMCSVRTRGAGYGDGQKLHLPLYQDSYACRIKRYNGSRDWWWLNAPSAGSAANFCYIDINGYANSYNASTVRGCAPAFCVA
jgi:hypothetical protein